MPAFSAVPARIYFKGSFSHTTLLPPHTTIVAGNYAASHVSSSTRSALEETLPITVPVFSVIAMCHGISKM
jgi:hypothetical protein